MHVTFCIRDPNVPVDKVYKYYKVSILTEMFGYDPNHSLGWELQYNCHEMNTNEKWKKHHNNTFSLY